MRKTILWVVLLLSLLVASCAGSPNQFTGKLPGFSNAYQLAINHYYPLELTAIAVNIFYQEWEREFGDETEAVYNAISNVRIAWFKDPIYNGCPPVIVYGTVYKQDLISVKVRASDKSLGATSLVHELVHVANHAIYGEYDYFHSNDGEQMMGWTNKHDIFIKKVNAKIRKAEAEFNKRKKP